MKKSPTSSQKLASLLRKPLVIGMLISPIIVVSAQSDLTYEDLVGRLYEMEYLATPPDPEEQSGNFSSFDRRSRYDVASDMYVDWDANRDGTGYIREEGTGIVVFEKDGPGVIWRFWSALALQGHIKVYVDHQDTPILDMSFVNFFDQIIDKGAMPTTLPAIPPINLPNLMPTLSRGRNRFIPIPFQQHCKIVLEKGWGMYYHITYSTYPNSTKLPVFDGLYGKSSCIALAEADRVLANRGYQRSTYTDETIEQEKINLPAGAEVNALTIKGNRAITHFSVNFDRYKYGASKASQSLLNDIWLQISWDDEQKPAVLVPLGLYFTCYPDLYPHRTYPIGALPGHLYSNWYMPFSRNAQIELINKGSEAHALTLDVIHIPLSESADDLLRFHSKWQNGLYLDEIQSKGREIDWPLLVTRGRGRFCGLSLHIENTWDEPEKEAENWWYGKWGYKTINWWWGEGDEKFYVDGEKFPSTYGTGSEDYIGYAWSAEPPFALFDSPFAAQPFTAIDGNGHTIVSRFHIADNIPFQKSFTGVIDRYKKDTWGDSGKCKFQTVAYWYLTPGQEDRY